MAIKTRLSSCLVLLTALFVSRGDSLAEGPLFERDIRPLLEKHCVKCHSGARRKNGLDVRQRRLLLRGGDNGPAVVPGNSKKSAMYKLAAAGKMPPGKRQKLTAGELDLLARWIDTGAATLAKEETLKEEGDPFVSEADRQWWAFRPLERPVVAPAGDPGLVRNPIDSFLLARLDKEKLSFSAVAGRRVLLRRATIGLTGLPPTPGDLDEFLRDDSPDAWERVLDRLLGSAAYGERWGRHWLDLAGYSDSEGYNDKDTDRAHAWRYRDYVIDSFNSDKPYDRFLHEQLAGDELAGYPGGLIDDDSRELLVATGFLRMCADGTGTDDKLSSRNQVVADTVKIFTSGIMALTVGCAQCHDHRYDPISQKDYHRIRAAFEPGYNLGAWNKPPQRLVSLYSTTEREQAGAIDAEVGKRQRERDARQREYVRAVVKKLIAEKIPEAQREAVRKAWGTDGKQRTAAQKKLLGRFPNLNISGGTLYQYDSKAADHIKKLDAEIASLAATKPAEGFIRAFSEIPGKEPPSRLFIRGDPAQPAEEVTPGPIEVLTRPGHSLVFSAPGKPAPALETSGRRLQLARWLTRRDHPLTARVIANRVWLHHFGRGLVNSAGDFGNQGEKPSHPQLLDWLACELIDGGWSLKRLSKLIMSSSAYRQQSRRKEEAMRIDPETRLLWRKPILRLEGESLRDAMLSVSGLLSRKAAGPPIPVKEDANGRIVVGIDKKGSSNRPGKTIPLGGEEWRRSIYIQAKRSRPLSFTSTFDSPVMNPNCTQRNVSIIASQALTMLNGSFVRRQAEALAALLLEKDSKTETLVRSAFARVLCRMPDSEEQQAAVAFVENANQRLLQTAEGKKNPAKARRQALRDFCQVLFNTSEFLSIE